MPKGRNKVMNEALTIYDMVKKDGGTYICKAENILGSAAKTAQLMVFSPLRFRVLPPIELTPVSFGSIVRLPCVAESDLKTTITWTKNGTTLPDETSILQDNTLVLDGFKKSHEGYYTCTATNALSKIKAQFSSWCRFLFCD